jgi:Tol biopolymer transport system component
MLTLRSLARALAFALLLPLGAACGDSDDDGGEGSERFQQEKIAFVGLGIEVINPEGTEQRLLTRASRLPPFAPESPRFSPDGRRIVFAKRLPVAEGSYETRRELYVMDVGSGEERRLTRNGREELGVDWLPDGRIVFASCPRSSPGTDERPECSLAAIRADGTGREELARLGYVAGLGGVSPDGGRVVYVEIEGQSHYQEFELVVMNLDGSGRRELTDNDTGDSAPAWSPDGERIAFMSNRAESAPCDTHDCVGFKNEIYVMDVDGSDVTRLTETPQEEYTPAWSADGEKIVYSRERSDGPPELFVMNADGSCPRKLAEGTEADWYGPPAEAGPTGALSPFLGALRRVIC